MSYNIHGVGSDGLSVIQAELSRTSLDKYFSRNRIFGYLRPVRMDENSLFDIKNVHPVFITKEGFCDITCKVRAVQRLGEDEGLKPPEILFVDNSPAQTAVAIQTMACHAFTVIDRAGTNSCISWEDMSVLLDFVRSCKGGKSLWFANSAGDVVEKSLFTVLTGESSASFREEDSDFGG